MHIYFYITIESYCGIWSLYRLSDESVNDTASSTLETLNEIKWRLFSSAFNMLTEVESHCCKNVVQTKRRKRRRINIVVTFCHRLIEKKLIKYYNFKPMAIVFSSLFLIIMFKCSKLKHRSNK